MITIQSVMLVTLGVLLAALVCLMLGPAYRRRVGRLTAAAIRRAMPLTEAEIRADKDRLRAEHAVTVHRLETKLEHAALAAARQHVEINRRDAAISALEGELAKLSTALDEHENARRVLEQTVMDRLPKLEQRLAEARRLLDERDREIAQLSEAAGKQGWESMDRRAPRESRLLAAARLPRDIPEIKASGGAQAALEAELDRQKVANQEQAAELASLKAALETYRAGERDDRAGKENKAALKARVAALEAQTAEQSATIQSLRAELAEANERLARQGAQFRDELRALGAGAAATSESEAPSAGGAPPAAEPRRRALSDRLREPRIPRLLKAEEPALEEEAGALGRAQRRPGGPRQVLAGDAAVADASPEGDAASSEGELAAGGGERRPRLLERITGLDKPTT